MFKRKTKTSPPPTRRQRLSSSQPVSPLSFSYHRPRVEGDANTGRQFRRPDVGPVARSLGRFWFQRFGLAILLIVGIVCLVYVLNLSTNPRIVVLGSTTGTALQNTAVYQGAFAGYLQGSIFSRNKVTINTVELSARLQRQYSELATVTVALPLLAHRPIVYIQPAHPALILHSVSGSFVLDTLGRALLASDKLSPDDQLKLPAVTDQSGLRTTLNQQVLTASDVSFVQAVSAQLATKQLGISAMTLPAATRELDVQLTGQPFVIKLNLQSNDPRQQIGTFLAVYGNLQSKHITPGQYVDVRVDGRAYYK